MQPIDGAVDYEKNDIPRYGTLERWTVDFGGGYEVDIKVCSSDDGDPLWSEGVLFLHGHEICSTNISDSLDGEYHFCKEPDSFIVLVKAE